MSQVQLQKQERTYSDTKESGFATQVVHNIMTLLPTNWAKRLESISVSEVEEDSKENKTMTQRSRELNILVSDLLYR